MANTQHFFLDRFLLCLPCEVQCPRCSMPRAIPGEFQIHRSSPQGILLEQCWSFKKKNGRYQRSQTQSVELKKVKADLKIPFTSLNESQFWISVLNPSERLNTRAPSNLLWNGEGLTVTMRHCWSGQQNTVALSLEKNTQKKNAQKTVHKSVTVSCLFCHDRATRKTISVRCRTELCSSLQNGMLKMWSDAFLPCIFLHLSGPSNKCVRYRFSHVFFRGSSSEIPPLFRKKNVFEPREMAYFNWNPSS